MDKSLKPLLEVKNLNVSFFTPFGEIKAVSGITYSIRSGEIVGIAGESGSGKSVGAYSIMGLQSPGKVIGGSILYEGDDVLNYTKKEMQRFRGNKVGIIFQNPASSLNPVYTIGSQLTEAMRCHKKITLKESKIMSINMLDLLCIDNPEKRMRQYPFELSGGMRQRVLIAMALACGPGLLIADEPTAALDVTVQAQILELLKRVQESTGMAVLFITHNLGIIAEICDRVLIMYAGSIVESGDVEDIFYRTAHPYTLGLLKSVPMADIKQHGGLDSIPGDPADLLNLPSGCPFAPRCRRCMNICIRRKPPPIALGKDHEAACWLLLKKKEDIHG